MIKSLSFSTCKTGVIIPALHYCREVGTMLIKGLSRSRYSLRTAAPADTAGLSHPGNRAEQLENAELARYYHHTPVKNLGIWEENSPSLSPSSPPFPSATPSQAIILSPGLLSSGQRTMSCYVPMGPGLRCPSSQPATWHRYRLMPSWSGQTPTSSPCMDCWTRPR